MGRVTTAYQRWVPKAAPDMNYPFAYETKCIKSIDCTNYTKIKITCII